MPQQTTNINTKSETPPNNELTHIEFNDLNTLVNDNSNDTETRLSALESGYTTNDGRTTTLESNAGPVQSYSTPNLPTTGTNGTIAYDTLLKTILYIKDNLWYRIDDNTQVIASISFSFTVQTDNAGTSASNQFTLPTISSGNYDFSIDWGDGNSDNITAYDDAAITHTYSVAGSYSISINGLSIDGWKFSNGGDADKIIEITDFGILTLSDASQAFWGCDNMTISSTNIPDTSNATNMYNTFRDCSSLTSVPLIQTNNATNFRGMFMNCSSLTTIPLIDTSNGTNFFQMFQGCSNLTSIPNLNLDGITTGRNMFWSCSVLNSIHLFDTSNCTEFNGMFFNCLGLTSIPHYDTSSATTLQDFLRSCRNIVSLPLFITSTVTNFASAFRDMRAITSMPVIDTSNGTTFVRTWNTCQGLTSFPILDLSSGTDFSYTWSLCTALTTFPLLDLSSGTDFSQAWEFCALDSTSVDNIMQALVANGSSNLSTSLAGGSTIPFTSWSAQAQSDHATLISRGWTIATN